MIRSRSRPRPRCSPASRSPRSGCPRTAPRASTRWRRCGRSSRRAPRPPVLAVSAFLSDCYGIPSRPASGVAAPAADTQQDGRRRMTEHPQPGLWARIRRARLVELVGVYAGISFGALQAVDVFIERLALPDWVSGGTLILLLLGLPLIAATAFVQAPTAKRTPDTAPTPEPEHDDVASEQPGTGTRRRTRTGHDAATAPTRISPEVPPPGRQGDVGRTPGWSGRAEGPPPPTPAVSLEEGTPPPAVPTPEAP